MPRLQPIDSFADQTERVHESTDRLPDLCGPTEVASVLRLSYSRVMQLQRQGKLRRFEHPDPITSKRYSGRKLAAYRCADGEGRHYFGSARKRA